MRALVAIILLIAWPAQAHDASRPDLSAWFRALKSDGGGPCCDGGDVNRAEVEWDAQGGNYRVRHPKFGWVTVPENRIVSGPNLAGYAMVWWYFMGGVPFVRCFLPGTLS